MALSEIPVLDLTISRSQRWRFLKRLMDLAGSTVLVVFLLPVLFVTATLIAMFDGLPIIYRRRVVGASGSFDAFKFRTMSRDADAVLERDQSMRDAFRENFKLKR